MLDDRRFGKRVRQVEGETRTRKGQGIAGGSNGGAEANAMAKRHPRWPQGPSDHERPARPRFAYSPPGTASSLRCCLQRSTCQTRNTISRGSTATSTTNR